MVQSEPMPNAKVKRACTWTKFSYICRAMRVFHDLTNLPSFKNAIVTIGSFDGVHFGHQQLLNRIRFLAQMQQGESVVVTFHPHPRLVVYPKDNSLQLITTIDEKIKLLERYGVDNVVVVPFTIEFSQLSADEYIQKFIVDKFHPRYVVIGHDHRFGLNRQGDINYLKFHGQKAGFQVIEIEEQEVENMAVSSTKIRQALNQGRVEQAAELLNHYFVLTGNVVRGQQIGTQIGFPTANLEIPAKHKLIPPDGVYAVFALHKEQRYEGMLYIGTRPTLPEHNNRTIEVNIFDFDKLIYGDKVQLELVAYIRGDASFDSLDELKVQLAKDRVSTKNVLQERLPFEDQQKEKETLPSVAVVILNYNTRDLLQKFIPSVLAVDYPNMQVWVADNGSEDGSVAMLRETFPEVECLELPINYGFAEGYNQALQKVNADYYLLLNSDVEVPKNWLRPLIQEAERMPFTGAAQPKILDYQLRDQFEYAGAAGGWIDFLGYPFCRGRIFATVEKDKGQYDTVQEIFWASGAAFLVRGPLFHQLGGFDGDYFAHLEEIDLCWRIKKAGYKILAVPSSEVYHMGGGTLDYESPRKTYLNFRNSLFTLLKNEPLGKLCWLLPVRLLMDGLAAFLFLTQGKTQHIQAILRAHRDFYKNFRKFWRKRKDYQEKIQRVSTSTDTSRSGVYPRSIVWQYYVKGKRHFKNLS